MSVALIGAIAVVVVGALGFVGTVYVQKQIRSAAEKQERIDAHKVDAEAYTRAQDSYERMIRNFREEVARLEANLESHRVHTTKLQKEITELQRRDRKRDVLAHRHSGWDINVREIIRRLDPDMLVPEPPGLYLD